MAKLSAYYGLCPLIDQKTLLGISQDEELEHVIVTLGKNIAIKYKLSDQKQIQSWRTKDKFTSPVLYDKTEQKYVAIFNQINLRLWSNEDMEHLDKIKKYKFTKPIYTIINCNNIIFIIFKNGCILTLKDALEQRRNLILKEVIDITEEEIIDVIHSCCNNSMHIGLIVQAKSIKKCIWLTFRDSHVYSKSHIITLVRDNYSLVGYTCCQMDKNLYFLTLWSDGQLYSYPLTDSITTKINEPEEFGSLYARIESISCKQLVAMTALANDHIAIYGADCNQEGASLIIYNTQFKISQSKQTFKLYTNTNRIWCIENVVLLCSGQYLAVVPYRISTEQLSELIGSHKCELNGNDVQQTFILTKWDIDEEEDYSNKIPVKIRADVINCLIQGFSENAICNYLIPKYIENSDIIAIENCIDYFKDISENRLVETLAFLIQSQLSVDEKQNPVQNNLIDKILSLPCTSSLLATHIKECFSTDITIKLLRYIYVLLSSETCLFKLNFMETENKLIEWGCIVLDNNYQKLLLSSDSLIHETLKQFNDLVQQHLMFLCELEKALPVIDMYKKGKTQNNQKIKNKSSYSIENIKLY